MGSKKFQTNPKTEFLYRNFRSVVANIHTRERLFQIIFSKFSPKFSHIFLFLTTYISINHEWISFLKRPKLMNMIYTLKFLIEKYEKNRSVCWRAW